MRREWNGKADPEDLILTCSDGVDDDGNGFTDDISGWDSFAGDNNPYDDTRFGHGTGRRVGLLQRETMAKGVSVFAPNAPFSTSVSVTHLSTPTTSRPALSLLSIQGRKLFRKR